MNMESHGEKKTLCKIRRGILEYSHLKECILLSKAILYDLVPFPHYQNTLPQFCCSVVPMGLIKKKDIQDKYLNEYNYSPNLLQKYP